MSTEWTDERGVTVQIGAVLLLGVLMLLLTGYQTSVVPAQNQNVEFTHNERVQSDLLEVRNGIVRAASSGATQPESVELGTTFPSRVVAINPAPASGRLSPSSVSGNATITGAEPLDPNARKYWLNDSHNMSYRTEGFRYDPSYREYGNAPKTVYENTVLYNEFPDGPNRTLSGQSIIDGRTISLVSLQGVPTRSSSGTVGVDIRAISPSSTQVRTIAVTNRSGEALNITLPTQLSNETWADLLAGEPYVDRANLSVDDGNVTIPMVEERDGAAVTYNLRTAAVTAARTAERPEPAYITVVDGANRSVPENTTNTLVAEVRDRYNNPVSGTNVDVDPPPSIDSEVLRSNARGAADFTYIPTSAIDDEIISFKLPSSIKANVTVSTFSVDESVTPELNYSEEKLKSSRSGRVNIRYLATGTGFLEVSLSFAESNPASAKLAVYSFGSSGTPIDEVELEPGESIRVDEDGNITVVVHDDVHEEDYSEETLVIPENESFGPIGGDGEIDYLFKDYEIDGDLLNDDDMTLTATEGEINVGSDGSVINGRNMSFIANGPNGAINVDGAIIETSEGPRGNVNDIYFQTTGDISAVGTQMETRGGISLNSDQGSIDLTGASLTADRNGEEITITAENGVVDLTDATFSIGNSQGTLTIRAETIIENNTTYLNGAQNPTLDENTP